MKNRSIFILTTFIVLLTINKITLNRDIKSQNEDISVVNISGRQRMYSQRITKFALLIKRDSTYKNSAKNLAILKKATANFKDANQNLKDNYRVKYDDFYLEELFEKLEPYYKEIINNADQIHKDNFKTKGVNLYINKIAEASDQFLLIMNDIVNQYELIGKNRGEQLLSRELTFNIIIGILSIYGVFFIIIPLINASEKTIL